MKNRHKAQKKAGGGNIVAAAKKEAESKSDSFKAGGRAKAGGMSYGGKAAARADKAPRKRAMGGALSSAARVDPASNSGPGSGHEDA